MLADVKSIFAVAAGGAVFIPDKLFINCKIIFTLSGFVLVAACLLNKLKASFTSSSGRFWLKSKDIAEFSKYFDPVFIVYPEPIYDELPETNSDLFKYLGGSCLFCLDWSLNIVESELINKNFSVLAFILALVFPLSIGMFG